MKSKAWKKVVVFPMLICGCMFCSCSKEMEMNAYPSNDHAVNAYEGAGIRLEDDFYGYVNFDFLCNNDIPSNMAEYSYGTIVESESDKFLSEEIIRLSESNEQFPFGSDDQKIKDLYLQYLDTEAREEAGIEPLRKGIDAVEQAENIDSFMAACGFLYQEYGCNVLYYPMVERDYRDSSEQILYLNQMDLLYTADELLGTANLAENVQTLMSSILETEGKEQYEERACAIVNMMLEIAENTSDIQKMDIQDVYNKQMMNDLKQLFDNIDVPAMLGAFGIENADFLVVYDMQQAETLNRYLTNEYLSVWKDYAICRLLYDYSAYLPQKYNETFSTINAGGNSSLEEKAIRCVKKELSAELGNVYAERYCDSETVQGVEELSESIKSAYYNVISNSQQLDDSAREKILLKLEKMTFRIGYPVNPYQSNSVISGGLLESCISIRKNNVLENLALYHTNTQSEAWDMTPQTFNAVYDLTGNSITIPAALFHKPFFDKDGDFYTNLGGLGTIIAHEMTHAFDEKGIQFDENGCYNPDWVGMEDKNRIEKLNVDVRDYFGDRKIMSLYLVDENLTADENIADVGALAVITSMTDNKEELKKIFENYAVIWATITYDTDALEKLFEDVHSPAEIRVNAVVSAIDKFYSTYDIKEDDEMYIKPEERMRIW